MAEKSTDAASSDVMDMFDDTAGSGVACRVCGSLVAATPEYRQAHWDWHETPNGA